MREKLFDNFKNESKKIKSFNLKGGKGMMQDLELLVHMGALITDQKNGKNTFALIDSLNHSGFLSKSEANILKMHGKLIITVIF